MPAAAGLVQGAANVNDVGIDAHISQIATRWSLVFQAHRGQPDAVTMAQQELMQRYCGAIYRYLLGALRDADAADDLSQEFALRFVRGDFRRADPQRGRFRDFMKTALFHLVIDHQRRRRGADQQMLSGISDPAVEESIGAEADQEFLNRWREELLSRSWEALARIEKESGQIFYTVLRFRAEHPDTRSAEMAAELQKRLGRPFTDANVRQTLRRAREKFADLLLEEVSHSLETTDVERLEQELIDLDLLAYCRSALERYANKAC
jgi:RNA polymerase sigma-70 factor (ECF subfamily)